MHVRECVRLRFHVCGTEVSRSPFLIATFYSTVRTALCLMYRINLWSQYHLPHWKICELKLLQITRLWAKESCLLCHVFVIKTRSQRVRINMYNAFVLGSIQFDPPVFPSSVHSSSVSFLSTNTSDNGSQYSFTYFTELPSQHWFQEIQLEKAIKIKE